MDAEYWDQVQTTHFLLELMIDVWDFSTEFLVSAVIITVAFYQTS